MKRQKNMDECKRYSKIMKTALEAVWIVDETFKTVFISDRMAELLGYGTEEIGDRSFFDFMDRETADEVIESFLGRKEMEEDGLDLRMIRKDGSEIWVFLNVNLLLGDRGEFLGVLGNFTDITERKTRENELNLLASIIRDLPDAVCCIDLSGKVVSWNKSAEALLGFREEEISGRPVTLILPEGDEERELAHCLYTLDKQGSLRGYISDRVAKDGRLLPVEITAIAMKDSKKRTIGYASVMRDITERKKNELEKEKLIDELTRTVNKVKTLRGLLHTCAWCRKIRDDKGSWKLAEIYIEKHSEAKFTHGICPECLKNYSPEAYHDLVKNPEKYEQLLEVYHNVLDPCSEEEGGSDLSV